jgi:hypothetical protein
LKILAIDPGNEQSAYVVWDGERLRGFDLIPNELLRVRVQDHLRSQTDLCVLEMIGHYGKGMPAGKTVFDTCVWIGRFGERYGWDRTEVVLRATVKAHLCGSSKAKDGNVIRALKDRFGEPGKKKQPGLTYGLKADIWQAFAVAVTWMDGYRGGENAA